MSVHQEEVTQLSDGNRITRWYRSIGMTPRSERHPNIVVRLIYAVAYWFGDFAPIVSTLIRFFANTFGVLINFAILGCIVAFSISHTIEFSVYVGAEEGYSSWILTFVFEIGFIYSSILLARDFKQGNRRSSPYVWAMFGIGLVTILVSNLFGMADNWGGYITAGLIPVIILLAKGMLGHQFTGNTTSRSDELELANKRIEELEMELLEVRKLLENSLSRSLQRVEEDINMEVEGSPTKSSVEESYQMETGVTPEDFLLQTQEISSSSKQEEVSMVNMEDSLELVPTDSSNEYPHEESTQDKIVEVFSTNVTDYNSPDGEQVSGGELMESVELEKSPKKSPSKKNSTKKAEVEVSTQEEKSPYEVALQMYLEDGEIPGRGRLQEVTGCSEWTARQTVTKLRKSIAETA